MSPNRPLHGVRIIDLSQVATGPYATMILAEQGADVVKVEPKGIGDLMRVTRISRGGVSAPYLNLNHGKRSIALDLASEEGRQIVLDLFAGADVVVQNFRPGVVDRLGVGYAAARSCRNDIVYVSISGYGPTGPHAERRVDDPIIQGYAGIVARQQSEAIPLPDLVRNIMIDKATGLIAAQAIVAALLHRERSADGDHLEIPMLDVALHFFWPDGMADHTFIGEGVTPGPRVPDLYQITQCADGQLIYFAATNEHRQGALRAVGRPDLSDDERFSTFTTSMAGDNQRLIGDILTSAFGEMPTLDALAGLHNEDVPAGPVNTPEAVISDEQVVHNGSLVTWDHPVAGKLRQPRHPVRFARVDTPIPEFAPLVGEHTDEILAEIGRTDAEVERLRSSGAVS